LKHCGAALADIRLHSLQDPSYYRSQVLPPPLKAEAERKLRAFLSKLPDDTSRAGLGRQIEGAIRYMTAADLSNQFLRTLQMTRKLDRLRNEPGAGALFPSVRIVPARG
jgi:hypothetical protein